MGLVFILGNFRWSGVNKMSFLQFGAFRQRARQRGLPASLKSWLRYEAKGLVTFRKLPTGRRIFKDMKEIDAILDKFEKQ